MSTELAKNEKPNALNQLAARLDMDSKRTAEVLKSTAFKNCKNDDQFAALVVVANTYGLNPLLKELYAFPGKGGEIVPIVSIDGWLRIINAHPQFNGLDEEFADDGSWCRVTIYRKDREHPTKHTEYFEEVKRNTDPWKQHPRRMLKWKTIIQAGRIAFGFGGIHDEDEGRDVSTMRDTNPNKAKSEPIEVFPEESQGATMEEFEETVKESPKGRQKKERFHAEATLIDITPFKTERGKDCWAIILKGKKGDKEFRTFSSTIALELSELKNDQVIKITFVEGSKGTLDLESFTLKEEVTA